MSQSPIKEFLAKSVGVVPIARLASSSNSNKNEIKISAEGVAKLTFSFLDDHHADSSLEPGEVKTPPRGTNASPSPSPLSLIKEAASSHLPEVIPVTALHNESTSMAMKRTKTTSQSDAQACQEKVRAILEMDAIKRREEAEKKKQQQIKGAKQGSDDVENKESKRKAKEEKKRLKKIKREERKAALELYSEDEDDGTNITLLTKMKKKKRDKESYSSEEEGENHDDDDDDNQMCANAISVPLSATPRYAVISAGPLPPHLSPFPDQFIGFRPMNPFMRMPRPDFHHQRGSGFHMRGRGGMRGTLRFPSFRALFHGSGPPRHVHAIPRQQTPPPARGHSPILAPPSDNLIWTTTKPSISYAFNTRDTSKTKLVSKPVAKELSPATKTEYTQNVSSQSSDSTIRKKSKKSREHQKKRRSMCNSSEKLTNLKVDKVRKTLSSSSECKRTKTPEIQFSKSDSETVKKLSKEVVESRSNKNPKLEQASDESEEMWDVDELQEPLTSTPPQPSSPAFELVKDPLTVKNSLNTKEFNNAEDHVSIQKIKSDLDNDIIPEGPALPPQSDSLVNETSMDTNNLDHAKNFDMFADSPPRPLTPPISGQDIDKLLLTARKAADTKTEQKHIKQSVKIENKSVDISGGSTPPKSLLKESPKVEFEKSSVQKAIEIQSQMNAQQETVLKSSKIKTKSLREENSALLKAIEAKNRINKLLNEDMLVSSSTSKLKSKSVADVQKSSLQKAIEAQCRIDELLKDDDLDPSTISKIKAKSLEHKLHKEKEAQSGSKLQSQKHEKPIEKLQNKARRSFTPELQTARPKNPFKRSISRERQKERHSRSRTPKRDLHTKRTIFDKHRNELRRSKSRLRGGSSFNRSGSNSFNRSHSAEKDREHCKRLRLGVDTKFNRSRSPRTLRGASKEKTKSLNARGKEISSRHKPVTSLTPHRNKNRVPLSFTAAEFLFPEEDEENEDDNSKSPSQKLFSTEDDTTSSEKPRNRSKKSKSHKDDSPDTDDYMDNWENDDVDLDINSNNACDSSTPMRSSSQEEVEEEKFVARFVNPSPPLFLQSLKETTTKEQQLITNLSETQDEKGNTYSRVESDQQVSHEPTQKKELFGMQEIYDQFIKSVEESGVDLKSTESNKKQENIATKSVSDKHEDNLSTSSTSTSSTSSSSCSSSSEASNSSTSSYSSSSSSASSSEESNDADCFKNITLESPKPKPKEVKTKPVIIVKIEDKTLTPPLPADKSVTPERKPLTIADATKAATTNKSISPSLTDSIQLKTTPALSETKTKNSAAPTTTAKSQKSDVAKDFKKLKSLEANLSRIQMMRANYDSADEISDELLKMEKLFLHEKNLILQKYAKSSKSTATESGNTNTGVPAASSGQFVASLQQTGSEIELEPATIGANKIFDANREAIKLTISPLKLPRTPAIFTKATTIVDSESHPTEPDEPDFTEKLQKPAKEVAIVKPMMETKELRSSQTRQHRRSTPPRTRSPSSSYHRERRRSISRSRYSPQQRRQQRGRSLSVSPPPRRSGAPARYLSPARRGVSNAFSTSQSRNYRNSGRRSRSRSRSISRQGNRRVNERSRRATAATPVGHSQPHYRKSTTQQRSSTRDSRSRSRTPPRSPPLPRSPPRPHSPRLSPSSRRRSYSRERYLSRSPLPFKPPSPPMRRSLSPNLQRRLSLSPEKRPRDSSAICRSRSHSRSRSPSIRYDDQRRHRSSSYDRHSPSLQSQYFLQDSSNGTASPASSYYYNLSPNRISLDARINIVLNGPPNQEGNNNASFDSYSNYSQYGGQYMSIPPQPDTTTYGINYGTNQYVSISSSDLSHPAPLSHQQVYSNIPTIGGGGISGTPTPTSAHSNYYYNEFSGHTNAHQSSSVLKELPKATVAVQKGNVLEIVPSAEMSERSDSTTTAQNDTTTAPVKPAKAKKTLSWKEEVNSRHVTAAVLRLSRENESLSKSILKKTALENMSSNEDQTVKKKVYFEDGIFPNRESDDEDRKIIDSKLRRKLRRLHKHHGITINAVNLVKQHKRDDDKKTDPELENAVPPLPPLGTPAPHLEQPIYLRPPSPTPLFYFHFDSVVHSMYVSQLERPIPPRLLNPKAVPPAATGPPAQSPSNTPSPNGAVSAGAAGVGATVAGTINVQSSKKELAALAALNRSNRSSNNERSSPKILPPTSTTLLRQRDNQANINSIDATHSETHQIAIKNSFHALPANVSTTLPASHMSPPIAPMLPQRQSSPIGFMGMRINNFMRLPPSPLARHTGGPLPTNNNGNGPAMAVIGMRHSFNMPPPSMMPPHILPSAEFSPQQHYNPMSHPNSPHMHHLNQPYPVVQPPMPHSHQHPHPHFPPTGSQASPHHMYHHHHRHQSPQFYMQSLPPPPPLPPPSRHTYVPPPDTAPPVLEETSAQLHNSPQAMVSPYNIQRQ